jgi:hypothetical protein
VVCLDFLGVKNPAVGEDSLADVTKMPKAAGMVFRKSGERPH